jgi:hypothetical protein
MEGSSRSLIQVTTPTYVWGRAEEKLKPPQSRYLDIVSRFELRIPRIKCRNANHSSATFGESMKLEVYITCKILIWHLQKERRL